MEVEIEPHRRVNGHFQGLVGGAPAEQQDDREAREGEQEDEGSETGDGAADGGPVDDPEALPWRQPEALSRLQPRCGDGVEPSQQDAGGEGSVQNDMGGENAAEAEDGDAEGLPSQQDRQLAGPACPSPHREQTEGNHETGGDDGGGKEADDEAASREPQAVQSPPQRNADGDREDSGQ